LTLLSMAMFPALGRVRTLLASLGARRKLDPEAMDYVLASALKPATW
jgi:hypothetical protein